MSSEPEHIPLDFDTSVGLCLHLASREDLHLSWERSDHKVSGQDEEHNKAFEFRFPLRFPFPENVSDFGHYASSLSSDRGNALIMLIRAGHAALAFTEGQEITHHKVISSYMVRAKQGKAQMTHLKTKGKSRAGSRIRLAEGEAMLQDIHEKIRSWEVFDQATHILYACPERLWSEVLHERTDPIIKANDSRLKTIPRDVDKPGFDELVRMNNFGFYGRLSIFRNFNFRGIEDFLP